MKISIVTVVLNDAEGLRRTLHSLGAQSHGDIDHVIVDGGSTDGTLDVAEAEKLPTTRIYSGPDDGIYDAMNKGLDRAEGEVVAFLNAGDRFAGADVLSLVAEALAGGAELAYGDLTFFDDAGRTVRKWRAGAFRRGRLSLGWIPPHPTVFARKALFARIGGFDKSFQNAGDYDWLLRAIVGENVDPVYVPRVLAEMEIGGFSNGSAKGVGVGIAEVRRAWTRNGFKGGLVAPYAKIASKIPQYAAGLLKPSPMEKT